MENQHAVIAIQDSDDQPCKQMQNYIQNVNQEHILYRWERILGNAATAANPAKNTRKRKIDLEHP